jgi:hypothetical protein
VVGVGNVAVDLARMILTPVDLLRYRGIFPLKYPAKCEARSKRKKGKKAH